MGSYDHGFQANKIRVLKTDPSESVRLTPAISDSQSGTSSSFPLEGINVENASRPMKYLQRVVKSLLRQMNVRSHVFGPGEAITIDLQAEIKYDDYIVLDKFSNAGESDDPSKQLHKVDDILSNLMHVVEHLESRTQYLEFILNLPVFNSLKFWLVLMTMSVIGFLLIMLSVRTVYASNNLVMLLYGFLIIYILSCIWTFSYMYEDERAANHAKLIQTQTPPKDCDFENLGTVESLSYFFRVHIWGAKDRCEQYYSSTMTDPFWRVNPLEAISKSFSVLVFSPFDYVGAKLGRFFGGVIGGIPFWLQPLLLLLVFGFLFMSLFGYRIVCPLFTIEPARHLYLEPSRNENGNAIEPAEGSHARRSQLVERPERKIMKSMKDASTDMDDFESYLNGYPDSENSGEVYDYSWCSVITNFMKVLWAVLRDVLDTALRQIPESEENLEENNVDEELIREHDANELFEQAVQDDEDIQIDANEENLLFENANPGEEIEDIEPPRELDEFGLPIRVDAEIRDLKDVIVPRRKLRRSRSQELKPFDKNILGDERGDGIG